MSIRIKKVNLQPKNNRLSLNKMALTPMDTPKMQGNGRVIKLRASTRSKEITSKRSRNFMKKHPVGTKSGSMGGNPTLIPLRKILDDVNNMHSLKRGMLASSMVEIVHKAKISQKNGKSIAGHLRRSGRTHSIESVGATQHRAEIPSTSSKYSRGLNLSSKNAQKLMHSLLERPKIQKFNEKGHKKTKLIVENSLKPSQKVGIVKGYRTGSSKQQTNAPLRKKSQKGKARRYNLQELIKGSESNARSQLKVIDQLCQYSTEKSLPVAPQTVTAKRNFEFQRELLNLNMVKQYPQKRHFTIQMPENQKFLQREHEEQTVFTPQIASRIDLEPLEVERSVQQPPRIHFPSSKSGNRTKNPHKRAKYNKFYRTQNFKKKKKLSLLEQIERSTNKQYPTTSRNRGQKQSHPLDIFNSQQPSQQQSQSNYQSMGQGSLNFPSRSNNFHGHDKTLRDFMIPNSPENEILDKMKLKIRFRDQQRSKQFATQNMIRPLDRQFNNTSRMWKFKGKELIIKKPNSKYRAKYLQFNRGDGGSLHKNTRSGGQFNTYSNNRKSSTKPVMSVASKTPTQSLNRNIFELSELHRVSKTLNPYTKGRGNKKKLSKGYNSKEKNGQLGNMPQSPVFIRRGLFSDKQRQIAAFDNWGKQIYQDTDCGGLGLDEYISIGEKQSQSGRVGAKVFKKRTAAVSRLKKKRVVGNKKSTKPVLNLKIGISSSSSSSESQSELEVKLTNRVQAESTDSESLDSQSELDGLGSSDSDEECDYD